MNVVFTTTTYLPHLGGIEFYIHEIAQCLIKNGHTVTIIVADPNCKKVQHDLHENENVIRLPAYEMGGFFLLKKASYLKYIDQEISTADVVHLNASKFLFGYSARQKKRYGYRLVVSSHGWLYHTKKFKSIKDMYFKNVIAKFAPEYDGIINVSYQDQKIALNFGVKNSVVIPAGVNCEKYANLPAKTEYTKRFVYLGRIAPNKGLLECLKKLAAYDTKFVFYIIGGGEDKEYRYKLEEFITKSGLNEKIVFLGTLVEADIRNQIEKADMILMPSLHEGFGMTLVECLKSGRPIIANTNDSYKYILKSVEAEEYLFDFVSEETSFESKVNELLAVKVVPKNVEQFSTETMFNKIFDVYGMQKTL